MRRNLALGLITGILLALSFPPLKSGFLAYGALIPFFFILEKEKGFQAFRYGYFTGLFIDIATLYWIGWVTIPGCIGALLVLPLFIGLYAWLHTIFIRSKKMYSYFALPFLWTAIEYLQSFGETAFPWNYIGYTQSYYLPLIQNVEYLSVYGTSFWIVLLNILLFLLWKHRHNRKNVLVFAFVFLAAFIIPLVHGFYALKKQPSHNTTLTIALIQGNIDPFEKWDKNLNKRNLEAYEKLSHTVLEDHPDLIIWPETAMPFALRYEPAFLNQIRNFVDSTNTPIMTGTIDYEFFKDGSYKYFNAAMIIRPHDFAIDNYRKMKLVPFSERVPYRNYFPFNFLKNFLYDLELGVGDYSLGQESNVFLFENKSATTDSIVGFSVPICYESVFPSSVRNFVKNGARFLTIITNDAWFGKTSAPFQHAQIAVFRAIENRTSIARCANTGISCFIDSFGRVTKSTPIFTETVVTGSLTTNTYKTFYTKYGNVFAQIVSLVTLLFILFNVTGIFLFKRKI